MNAEHFIELYFYMGLSYKDIKNTLQYKHRYEISLRHLKRKLNMLKLTRRKDYSDLNDVFLFVENQLESTGQMHGYRWMYEKCMLNGLVVRKEHVRVILQILDPHGVNMRKHRCLKRRQYWSKGPNFCWHIDGYDKLKPYGLCINGCIDGYSRKVIWLKAERSNNNSKLIAKYFIDAVEEQGGCPAFVRGDMGTENIRVAAMQRFLRRSEEDANHSSFIYGKSTMNTRIEAWWGILRKECCHVWIEELRTLRDEGDFTRDMLDINLSQFCFLKLLQDELNEAVMVWNMHKIRPSANTTCPSGRPYVLYLLNHLENVQDYLCDVAQEDIEICRIECSMASDYPCEEEVFELCCIYMAENNLNPPTEIAAAKRLYLELRQWLKLHL